MKDNITKIEFDKVWLSAATTIVEQYNYNDIIPMQEIQTLLDIEFPETGNREDYQKISFHLLTRIESLKQEMLSNYKMLLVNIRGEGYRILKPNQHADYAMQKVREGLTKVAKQAKEVLENTNYEMLTNEERQHSLENSAKLAAVSAFSKKKLNKL